MVSYCHGRGKSKTNTEKEPKRRGRPKGGSRERQRTERLYEACDRVLDKLIEGLENADPAELVSDKNGLKAIAACLEDLKSVLDIRSPRDLAEQDARIARLMQSAGTEEGTGQLVVTMDGEAEEYAG